MLQDSAFDIESWLSRALAMRLGRAINAHFTNGSGGGTQPEGVITGAQSYGTTATGAGNVTGVTYDNLVNLIHSVDPSYRDNAEWMFHDSTLRAIKQLKDGQQRPLWQQDMALGERPTILGYPYVINQDVPVMAASAKSILFGDFSYYLIRDVQDIRLLRLDERYADFLQTGFLAFLRTDGLLANAGGTNSPVKYYANSAT
jgi:HK97 family phage major capsid protein